jgi:RimJ/RimL family protein N-acetyltransferase
MNNRIWEGRRVRLRGVEPADWETLYDWGHDTESSRHSYEIPFPQSRAGVRQWAEQTALSAPQNDAYRFQIENLAGELVGTLNTHTCNVHYGTFSYGLAIRAEHQRQGYASEAIVLALRYFFRELRYQKVTVEVYSFNEPSIRLHERLGFALEGRLRRMGFSDGAYYDSLIFGLTVEEFTEKHLPALKDLPDEH